MRKKRIKPNLVSPFLCVMTYWLLPKLDVLLQLLLLLRDGLLVAVQVCRNLRQRQQKQKQATQ